MIRRVGADAVCTRERATRGRGIRVPGLWARGRRFPPASSDAVKSVFGSSRGRGSPGVSRGRKGAAMRRRWKSSPLAPRASQQAKSTPPREQRRRAMIIAKQDHRSKRQRMVVNGERRAPGKSKHHRFTRLFWVSYRDSGIGQLEKRHQNRKETSESLY
jgi:hypothetical protein